MSKYGISSQMERNLIRWYWTLRFLWRIFKELVADLAAYYVSPYPLLLIRGAFLRAKRRIKIIWLPPKRGRPPITPEIIDLILDMKRNNLGWGSLTISNALNVLRIKVSKTTVLKILRENGFIPPKTKFTPPDWQSFLKAYSRMWQHDFTCVFDSKGSQLFIFNVIDGIKKELVLSNVTENPTQIWVTQQFRNIAAMGLRFP